MRTRAESGFVKREFLDHRVSEQFTGQFAHARQRPIICRSRHFHFETLPLADAEHITEPEPLARPQDRLPLGVVNLRLEHDLHDDPGHCPAFPRSRVAPQRTRHDHTWARRAGVRHRFADTTWFCHDGGRARFAHPPTGGGAAGIEWALRGTRRMTANPAVADAERQNRPAGHGDPGDRPLAQGVARGRRHRRCGHRTGFGTPGRAARFAIRTHPASHSRGRAGRSSRLPPRPDHRRGQGALPRPGHRPPDRHRGDRLAAAGRARHLGLPARPGGGAGRFGPGAVAAGYGLPHLPRARGGVVPGAGPDQAAGALPRRQPRRLGSRRSQFSPVHHCHRRSDAARHRLRDGYPAGRTGRENGEAAIVYFGDGATSQGDVNEAFIWASVFNAPVVFFCQNNQWAISEPLERQSRIPLYQRASGFGFPGVQVDGNDVFACLAVTRKAMQAARDGQGPTLIEAYTYRMGAHTTTDDPTRYRLASELEAWKLKDPVERVKAYLVRTGSADAAFFEQIDAEAAQVGTRVRRACLQMPDPAPLSMFDNVYAEPTALLREEREQYAAYLDSFVPEEVAR